MFNDKGDISPIDLASSLTPGWMMKIREFDGMEIKPCKVIGRTQDNAEIIETCRDPSQATFWTVYGHYRPIGTKRGVEAFEDFATEAEAQKFHDQLTGIFPHLDSKRPKTRPMPISDLTLE